MGQCVSSTKTLNLEEDVYCICGSIMQMEEDVDLSTIICDICKKQNFGRTRYGIFWRCSQRFNIVHPDGYDICKQCRMKHLNVTEVTEPANNAEVLPNQPSEPIIPLNDAQQFVFDIMEAGSSEKVQYRPCAEKNKCMILRAFIGIMKQYNENHLKVAENMDEAQLVNVVDCFLHLIHHHDDDQQFQDTFDDLRSCDIVNCNAFRRNYRNRIRSQDNDDNEELKQDCYFIISIMDKMHCHFQHCFDIGNRATIQDKTIILNILSEQKHNDNVDECFVNQQSVEITKIIQEKKNKLDTIYPPSNDKIYNKYNQLFIDNETKQDDDQMYKFGFGFSYGEKQKDTVNLSQVLNPRQRLVMAQYESLKQEVLQNPFAVLNIDQWNNEYKKSMIYLASEYAKRSKIKMTLHQILALLIYCNYTDIQCAFSKTYRENNGDNHKYFWFWGKLLKVTIEYFGTKASFPNYMRFYHGVNKLLYLPSYITTYNTRGLSVNCPISVSSAFEVAANFATNNGVIIELNLMKIDHTSTEHGYEETNNFTHCDNYLSLSWLSDFNEKESLFLQGRPTVIVANIIEIHNGYQYHTILDALNLIHNLLDAKYAEDDIKALQNESTQILVGAILEDRLSTVMPDKYRPFKSLSIYGRQIVNAFFEQRTKMTLHYWNIRKYYAFLSELFVHSEFEWIKLDHLMALCPNIGYIHVCNIKLTTMMFKDILRFFSNTNIHDLEPIAIEINPINDAQNELTINDAMTQYSSEYNEINAYISTYADVDNVIIIERMDKVMFAAKIVIEMLKGTGLMLSDGIKQFTQNLLLNRLYGSNLDDVDQIRFNEWCGNHRQIEYNNLGSDIVSFLHQYIGHSEIDYWIQMDKMSKLFPNMVTFEICIIKLCKTVMEDIVALLRGAKLQSLTINVAMKGKLSKSKAVKKYTDILKGMNYNTRELKSGLKIDRSDLCMSINGINFSFVNLGIPSTDSSTDPDPTITSIIVTQ